MPATTNPDPATLLTSLQAAFPDLTFRPSHRFSYRPPRTIHYDPSDPDFPLLILHEVGHATIGINTYSTDVGRLKIERAAWDAAATLCTRFAVKYDSDFVENKLDTYRDWLHAKSRCKTCGLTRYQDSGGTYHCPHCEALHPRDC